MTDPIPIAPYHTCMLHASAAPSSFPQGFTSPKIAATVLASATTCMLARSAGTGHTSGHSIQSTVQVISDASADVSASSRVALAALAEVWTSSSKACQLTTYRLCRSVLSPLWRAEPLTVRVQVLQPASQLASVP